MTKPSQSDKEIPNTPVSMEVMSLLEHLQELRQRIIVCLIAISLTSAISYFYAEDLVKLITAPAGKLYFMTPAEVFFSYLKISLFSGFLAASPIVLYQLWAFITPALTRTERTLYLLLTPSSVILFFIGILFSYFFVLPTGIQFFIGFATENWQPMFSLGEYLSFVISFLLPFGFIFELPLFILVLAKLSIVSSSFLKTKRKSVLVLSFVIGAVVSPTPDIFSQTMIAIPIIFLYEISFLLVKYSLQK